MVCTLHALVEFIYLIWQNNHSQQMIQEMEAALEQFQTYQSIFVDTGIWSENLTPLWQLLLIHYIKAIKTFGALNGLCSSLTESKHIRAIKEPWWCSNHYHVLKQMLLTNKWLDKLVALCADFAHRWHAQRNVWFQGSWVAARLFHPWLYILWFLPHSIKALLVKDTSNIPPEADPITGMKQDRKSVV